jgi:hypothetical protein
LSAILRHFARVRCAKIRQPLQQSLADFCARQIKIFIGLILTVKNRKPVRPTIFDCARSNETGLKTQFGLESIEKLILKSIPPTLGLSMPHSNFMHHKRPGLFLKLYFSYNGQKAFIITLVKNYSEL